MKRCNTCNLNKGADCFYSANNKDGKSYSCKECIKAKRKKYYISNKNKIKTNVNKWKAKNRDRDLNNKKEWYKENALIAKAASTQWIENNREKHNKSQLKWAHNNLDKRRDTYFRRVYGFSLNDYCEMLDSQDGKCAICKLSSENKVLHVDHCHNSNKIRGLLCGLCNRGLGMFKDSINYLKVAVEYLEKKG